MQTADSKAYNVFGVNRLEIVSQTKKFVYFIERIYYKHIRKFMSLIFFTVRRCLYFKGNAENAVKICFVVKRMSKKR